PHSTPRPFYALCSATVSVTRAIAPGRAPGTAINAPGNVSNVQSRPETSATSRAATNAVQMSNTEEIPAHSMVFYRVGQNYRVD
ncbi:MAG TPA: hypothetical protein VGG16_21280, partial [Streptosporangiaceae bacterium]